MRGPQLFCTIKTWIREYFFSSRTFEFEKVSDCEYCAYVGGITQYEESVCFHTPLLPSPLNMEMYILNSYKNINQINEKANKKFKYGRW